MEILCGRNVEVQQAGEWKIDRCNFLEIDLVVDTSQRFQVLFADGEGCLGAQCSPFLSIKTLEARNVTPVNHAVATLRPAVKIRSV